MAINAAVLAFAAMLLLVLPLRTQEIGSNLVTVVGRVVGRDGKSPVAAAVVQLSGRQNALKYSTETNQRGEFAILGVQTGAYDVTITQNNEVIWSGRNFGASLAPGSPCVSPQERGSLILVPGVATDKTTRPSFGRCRLDVNLAEEAKKAPGQLSPEERKRREEVEKENARIGDLNSQFKLAVEAEKAGDFDKAISILHATTQAFPNSDKPFANLANAYLQAKRYPEAVEPLQKAIALKPSEGIYHMALGDAYDRSGRPDEATAEYTTVAQMDPTQAAMAYFKIGAVWTNASTRVTDVAARKKDLATANDAFDKAVAAKPDFADAYYQKGINLLSQASYDKDGKIVAVSGTAEVFQKYVELAPTGPHAEEAKQLLAGLGAQIQTTFKKGKGK